MRSKRSPFLIFAAIVSILVTGMILFIQSSRFAQVVKTVAAKYVPKDMGIEGDFSEFAVKLFPPGVSIRNPRIQLGKHNIVNLPPGSSVSAERIDLNFTPFQMLSGNIRVHEVVIVNGDVRLFLDENAGKKAAPRKALAKGEFHWDELLQIHAEAVAVQNTAVHVESEGSSLSVDLVAESLRLGQWEGKGGLGYELLADLRRIRGNIKGFALPENIDEVQASAHVNALGLDVSSLSVSGPGIEATATGSVKGNLLAPKGLALEASMSAKGDAAQFASLAGKSAAQLKLSGTVSFNGKVRGNLERLSETFRADGTLLGRGVRFRQWAAEQLEVDGSYSASPRGGEVAVTKAVVSSPEVPRKGGAQPGSGGRIEIGAFRVPLGTPPEDPIQVPVKLEHAHIHWLAAVALKDVYPLDFRVSGPMTVGITLPDAEEDQPWEIDAKLGLTVDNFSLDNQRLGKNAPVHSVLKIPRIGLDGDVIVDEEGIHPLGLTASLPHSKFRATGIVSFKNGFDLYAGGATDLADIGTLAENDLRGQGTVNCHIHGPSSRTFLDFDADIANGYYLKMKLGNVKGRITYDEDPQQLFFTKLDLTKGRSAYTADGMIDLGKDENGHDIDTVSMNVHIPKGDIQDFSQIFDEFTGDLWWFPHTLTGAMNGDVKISGGIDLKKLEVFAHIYGTGWEHLGERFNTVYLEGGYDKGRYHIAQMRAVKHAGRLSGRISFDADRRFDWQFQTTDFTVSDLDHFAQLDVPIRGKLYIDSVGSGKEGSLRSATQVSLGELSVRGQPMQPSLFAVRTENGALRFQGSVLGGQGTFELSYDFDPKNQSYLRAELKRLDFSPVLLLLNPKSIQDHALAGLVSGAANLSFRAGEMDRASGRIDFGEYVLARSDARFQLAEPVSVKMTDGTFDLPALSIRGNQGTATLSLQGRKASLDGKVSGDLDVSIAEFFTATVAKAEGTAGLDFIIGGAIKEPTIVGKADVGGARFRIPSIESPFENVTGTLQLRQNVVSVQGLEGDLAGGRVGADGTIQLFADRFPTVNLKGSVTGSKLKIYPFQFVKVHGNLAVTGSELPYLVSGKFVVDSALSTEKIMSQKQGEQLKAVQYTPPPSARRGNSDYPWFKLNVDVSAEKGVFVQNDLFDAELKGDVTVVNTLETPRLVGNGEMISGKMIFKDRVFQIQSATASFDNPTVINPSFNLTANTEVNGTKIQMFASGRMDKWKIDLTSNPVMPESDILSLLALGMTSENSKHLRATDRAVYDQSEAASLLLHSLDFNREVQSKTGFQIQIDESVNTQSGTSVFRPQASADQAAAPKIVIRKQIGKQLDVSYGSTVGVGTNNQKEVNAEYHLTPGLSVIGVWDNYETVDTQDNRTSYGFDLKLEKRFK